MLLVNAIKNVFCRLSAFKVFSTISSMICFCSPSFYFFALSNIFNNEQQRNNVHLSISSDIESCYIYNLKNLNNTKIYSCINIYY
jgi:hypothetical protein